MQTTSPATSGSSMPKDCFRNLTQLLPCNSIDGKRMSEMGYGIWMLNHKWLKQVTKREQVRLLTS